MDGIQKIDMDWMARGVEAIGTTSHECCDLGSSLSNADGSSASSPMCIQNIR